jgi:protein-disulfide isomerase
MRRGGVTAVTLKLALAVALAFPIAGAASACGSPAPATVASLPGGDVDLPGVDTRDFTPRERHELTEYVTELASPCPSVAVPIAQCVLEKRACPACLPAAQAIAKAVREGMARDQVEALYKHRFDPASSKTIPLDGSPARGPESAPVTVVEFADFECPFCQQLAPVLDEMWDRHKDAVRFVYKFFPLPMHPHGELSARAAIAAQAQGKFWEMHRQLFASRGRLEMSDLEGYAKAVGLDVERFRADMQSAATKARIDADKKLGDELGIRGTPTIYIDGREYDTKVDLGEWVDGEIAARRPK